jgi:hypothetical protein
MDRRESRKEKPGIFESEHEQTLPGGNRKLQEVQIDFYVSENKLDMGRELDRAWTAAFHLRVIYPIGQIHITCKPQ